MSEAANQRLSPNQSGLTPLKLIQTYSPEDWEAFIEEWTEGFDPAYTQVVRIGGAGDLGRDIIGHLGDPKVRPWSCDVYQCKHYDHPLRPSESYVELGKLCVFTHRDDYPIPRHYRFVPPRGVGPKLYNLLNYPDRIKAELISNWDQYCRNEISDKEEFPLTGSLKDYVEAFDFSIVGFIQPAQALTQHQRTKYWYRRFKSEPPVRQQPPDAPENVQSHEMPYIASLLEAYADHLKRPVTLDDLNGLPNFLSHLRSTRGYFFSAEALDRFSRDHFTPGAFNTIKKHVFDGVIDMTLLTHADGLACLIEVTKQALTLVLPPSDLLPYVWPADRKGICHHLANDGKLGWVKKQ
jgi:hypothetical protein